MQRAYAAWDLVLEGAFGRVAVEIKHTSPVDARDLRNLREFVTAQRARLGVVINADVTVRHYDDTIVGLPLTHL